MARYGYSYVNDRGFASFSRVLLEGAWKAVSIKDYDSKADPPVAKPAVLEATPFVLWKLRATWAIRGLVRAMGGATAEELQALDAEWDSAQRAFHSALGAEVEHPEAERRAGAERLRAAMLLGEGTAQTRLSYDKEVDFGYAQLELARKSPLQADLTAAGLGFHVERIEKATLALALGLGREPGTSRSTSRKQRLREALSVCTAAFNAIHGELGFWIEHVGPGPEREHLEALRAPFLALLERYPAGASPRDDEAETEEESAAAPAVAAELPGDGG